MRELSRISPALATPLEQHERRADKAKCPSAFTCTSSESSTAARQSSDTPCRQRNHSAASAQHCEASASGQVTLASLRLALEHCRSESERAWCLAVARTDEIGERLLHLQLRRRCKSERETAAEPERNSMESRRSSSTVSAQIALAGSSGDDADPTGEQSQRHRNAMGSRRRSS